MHKQFFTIATCLIAFSTSIQSMEPPVKKRKAESGEIVAVGHSVPPLTQIASRYIVSHLASYNKFLLWLPSEIIDEKLKPELIAKIKNKFYPALRKPLSKVASPQFDSECVFTPSGKYIIHSTQNEPENKVRIFELAYVLEHPKIESLNFAFHDKIRRTHIKALCINGPQAHIYCLNNCNQLIEYYINRRGFIKCFKISDKLELAGTIDKIFPHPKHGVIALSTIKNDQNQFKHQNIYWLSKQLTYHHRLIAKSKEKIAQIHELAKKERALVFEDGSVQIMDSKNKERLNWKLKEQAKIRFSCTNPDKTKIATLDKLGQLKIYDLNTQKVHSLYSLAPFHAVKFYDNDCLLAAHNHEAQTNRRVFLTLWDLKTRTCIAHTTQEESRGCNTIDISPNEKDILLGMEHYDIGLNSTESFEFDPNVIDPIKIFSDPAYYIRLQKQDKCNFAEKLAFMKKYIKAM